MVKVAGKDATKEFNNFHNVEAVLRKYGEQLYAGEVSSAGAAPASAPASKPTPARAPAPASAPAPSRAVAQEAKGANMYGELIPYGDPNWYQGWNSNLYNESHIRFRFQPLSFSLPLPFLHCFRPFSFFLVPLIGNRAAIRAFVGKEITPNTYQSSLS